jgi:thiamine transporter ThiT
MKKRKNIIVILSILLVISIGNFFRISSEAVNIRTVDFLSIFAIGALAGLLIGLISSPKQSE